MQKLTPNVRFAVIYFGAMVLLGTVVWVLENLVGYSAGSSMTAVLPLISGMYAGQYAARDTGDALPKPQMWSDALVFSVIVFVVSFFAFAAITVATGSLVGMLALISEVSAATWALSFIGIFLLSVLMIRVGYGLGIRNELKMQEKRTK